MRPVILGTGRRHCRRNQGIWTLSHCPTLSSPTLHSTVHPSPFPYLSLSDSQSRPTTSTENYSVPWSLSTVSQGKCIVESSMSMFNESTPPFPSACQSDWVVAVWVSNRWSDWRADTDPWIVSMEKLQSSVFTISDEMLNRYGRSRFDDQRPRRRIG